MKIKGLLLILEPSETMEEGVHQYAPCWSSCSAKESLQGLKAEGLDQKAWMQTSPYLLFPKRRLRTPIERLFIPNQKNSRLFFWRLARVPGVGSRC